MSIYDFYPMKKRRICRTPNGGRQSSTLGKLKNGANQLGTSAVDSGIEVLWDNNSPSPTTTLALGKRQRKRQKYNNMDEHTDISFVVQKLSENTSPIVDNTRSALLEMWVKDENGCINDDENFTSPHEIQRECKKATKRSTRKTSSKQFMLEIRKLVDEIQKNDEGNSSQGSKTSQNKTKEQSLKREEQNKVEVSTDFNDSFGQWTEDDMDDLILTCQLSSSGKGSINDPAPPTHPQFGFSPSTNVVPETQVLFSELDITREQQVSPEQIAPQSYISQHAQQSKHAQQLNVMQPTVATQRGVVAKKQPVAKQQVVIKQHGVVAKQQCVPMQRETVVTKQPNVAMQPAERKQQCNVLQSNARDGNQHTKKLVLNGTNRVPCTDQQVSKPAGEFDVDTSWGNIFDEDDSLLECAAQEFELSQKTSHPVVNKQQAKAKTGDILPQENNFTKVRERNPVDSQFTAEQLCNKHGYETSNHTHVLTISHNSNISMKCDHNMQNQPVGRQPLPKTHHSNDVAMKTDKSLHNDITMKCIETISGRHLSEQKCNRQEKMTESSITSKKINNQDCVGKISEKNEFMLDDLDDLLQDFNFEDLRHNSNNENRMTSTQLPSKKASYSKQEIEAKRKAAQRRRFAKTQNTRRR